MTSSLGTYDRGNDGRLPVLGLVPRSERQSSAGAVPPGRPRHRLTNHLAIRPPSDSVSHIFFGPSPGADGQSIETGGAPLAAGIGTWTSQRAVAGDRETKPPSTRAKSARPQRGGLDAFKREGIYGCSPLVWPLQVGPRPLPRDQARDGRRNPAGRRPLGPWHPTFLVVPQSAHAPPGRGLSPPVGSSVSAPRTSNRVGVEGVDRRRFPFPVLLPPPNSRASAVATSPTDHRKPRPMYCPHSASSPSRTTDRPPHSPGNKTLM
jgi:hypothetical protein